MSERSIESEYHVDQPTNEPFDVAPAEKSKDIEQYRQQGQALIDSYQRFFITFAEDVSLRFRLSNAFFIDLEHGEVNLDTSWFSEKECSQDQILWANLHELAHFRDLMQDPEKMMGNFEYMRQKARQTGSVMMEKWEKAFGASDEGLLDRLRQQQPISKKDPSKTMNAVEQAAYKIHHTFYNIFDDIYVNNLVARRAAKYEVTQSGGQEVTRLYKEKLFPQNDYAATPRHLQFLYKLLREEMVPDETVQVSEEVNEVLDQKMLFQGKEYTPRDLVSQLIKPKGGRDTKPGQRYFILQKTIEPIFERLLMKDLEDWQPQKPQEQQGEAGQGEPQAGDPNPFSQDYQDFEQNNPDQIQEDDLRDWLDKDKQDKEKQGAEQTKQNQEENKSAEEKAKESQEKLDRQWCEHHKIRYETFEQFRTIEAEVAPYLDELSQLWQRIIFGSTRQLERGMEGYFKTGTELDIGKVIEQWPQLEKKEFEKVEAMKRMISKETLIKKPELIRVRLVGDMSGSMDQEKRHTLQQCFVLILSSLREFNTYLNLTRSQTKTKLETDSEAWIFGDSAQKVKRLRSESGLDDEQVEVIRVFENLQQTIGSTYDNVALEAIFNELTPEDRQQIAQEKIMEMVFEITDSGSSKPEDSKKAVSDLVNTGVITRAFQIGKTNDKEQAIFNEVWNKGREEKLGEMVGPKIANLLPAITELLKKHLGVVRL